MNCMLPAPTGDRNRPPAGPTPVGTHIHWRRVKRGVKQKVITPIAAPEAFWVEAIQAPDAEAETPAPRALWGHLSGGGRFPPIDRHCPARSPDYARLSGSLTNVSDRTVRDSECDGCSAVVATIRIMLATPGSSDPVTRMRHSKVRWAIIGT